MKKLTSFIMVVFFATTIFAQASKSGPEIKFEKTVHNYGNIVQGADGSCEFVFKNIGNEPLILSNVASSCGCTVPDWPKNPILPNQTASIKVKYDTKRVGTISKSVTVFSNATTDRVMLQLSGNVAAQPTEAIPEKPQNAMRP